MHFDLLVIESGQREGYAITAVNKTKSICCLIFTANERDGGGSQPDDRVRCCQRNGTNGADAWTVPLLWAGLQQMKLSLPSAPAVQVLRRSRRLRARLSVCL